MPRSRTNIYVGTKCRYHSNAISIMQRRQVCLLFCVLNSLKSAAPIVDIDASETTNRATYKSLCGIGRHYQVSGNVCSYRN